MNKFPPLSVTGNEPEYQKYPSLPVSSTGTQNTKKSSSQMPFGSAILTDTGNSSQLKNNGITHVIHSALMPQGNNEEVFIKKAVLAMQNSIILADSQGFDKLATCFLAGGIFCSSEETKPRLAEALIRGALSQLKECQNLQEVIFVDFDAYYLKDARNKIAGSTGCPANLIQTKTVKGKSRNVGGPNLLHKSLHGARVIVNSENAEMGWGGGISGDIKTELGTEESNVDRQRKDLMREFNSLISEDKDKPTEITRRIKYKGPKTDIFGTPCFSFKLQDDSKPRAREILISKELSFFTDNPPKNDVEYELTWKAKIKIGEILKTIDITKIEEIKDKDKKPASEWQEELKEIDSEMEQIFTEDKVKNWKEQGQLGKLEKVKQLLESVKEDLEFLNSIKDRGSDSLKSFVSEKKASEVITTIKRFEYDKLSQSYKEVKNKKIRRYWNLGENDTLNDDQINEYCYRESIGRIDENKQNPNNTNTINPEKNILKYLGIGALILMPLGLLFALFVRKRKKY